MPTDGAERPGRGRPPDGGGWTWIDDRIIKALPTIGHTAMCTYLVLAQHADSEGLCRPPVARVCRMIGRSRRITQLALTALAAAGLIEIMARHDATGRRLPNYYRLLAPSPGRECAVSSALAASSAGEGAASSAEEGAANSAGTALSAAQELDPVEPDPDEPNDDHSVLSFSEEKEKENWDRAREYAKRKFRLGTNPVLPARLRLTDVDRRICHQVAYLVITHAMPDVWVTGVCEAIRHHDEEKHGPIDHHGKYLLDLLKKKAKEHGQSIGELLARVEVPDHLLRPAARRRPAATAAVAVVEQVAAAFGAKVEHPQRLPAAKPESEEAIWTA